MFVNFNKLSIEEKFGQMFILGLDVYDINDEIIDIIKKYKIGGIVLYKKNYTSIETMAKFINKIKEINKDNKIPLFISIDQENGRVNRLPKEINTIYSALKQADTKNMKIINAVNDITTYILKSVGVNMNFAPVLDIHTFEKNKAIGNRSYGRCREDVLKYAMPFMKTMQENGIVAVVKHFPGHGHTSKDSHFVLPRIKDVDGLKEDLNVFYDAIDAGTDAIMIGHLALKGYGLKPASINKAIINDFLISKKDFKGLIISDDLRMNSLKLIFGIKKSINKSIDAGNNMIMIKYKKNDSKKIFKYFSNKVKNFEIDPEIIDRNAKKIIAMKKKYKITDEELNPSLNIDLINDKIKKINDLIEKTLDK